MKMVRSELLAALNVVRPAIAAKDLIEELAHVWFDGETMTAYNDADLGMQVPFVTPFKGGLRGELLFGILNNSRAKEVSLEDSKNEGQMVLKAAAAKVDLVVLPEDRAVWQFPEVDGKSYFTIRNSFLAVLKAVLVAVGNDTTKPEKLGVTFEFDKSGAVLYTTDSKSIAEGVVHLEKKGIKEGRRVILPTAFCEQVLRTCADGDRIDLWETGVVATTKAATKVYARQVDFTDPLDFASVLDKHNVGNGKGSFEIPARLELALERALVILNGEPGENIRLTVSAGKLRLEVAKEGRGTLDDSVPIDKGSPPDVSVLVDPAMLKRALPLTVDMIIGKDAVLMLDDQFSYLVSTSYEKR